MRDPYSYPKLRWPVDIRFHEVESQRILLISCPLGIASTPLGLVAGVAPIIAHFDGSLSIQQIAEKFVTYGVKYSLLQELVKLLDDNLFLESPRFFGAEREIKERFRLSDVRPAALAGGGYPHTRELLEIEIDRYLSQGNGIVVPAPGKLVGIVSPHIDYRRGGVSYGFAYNPLRHEQHDLYIVIGTSHQYSKGIFHLTMKDFETPLGTLSTDRDFVKRLASQYGSERSFSDEFLHKREHSLELQLPFLKRLCRDSQIVPILVGSFYNFMKAGKLPEEWQEYQGFIGALSQCVREERMNGRKVCVIAGVDMAHLGRNFGDDGALSEQKMQQTQERDKIYLDSICRQDRKALFSHVVEDSDARRICGYPTMYTVIDLFDRIGIKYTAKIFDYRQAVDYATDCAVTFAGMGLYE